MTIPEWVPDAIFYQIFPDRFARDDSLAAYPTYSPPNLQPWGSPPSVWGFQGGNFRGIMQRFDYLLDLGINAIYLNPVFLASSNHRYNTTDYFQIDPKLGSQQDFKALLALAHQNGVRVMLDGVFNHCGRGFFAFSDILENQDHSPYLKWFHIKDFPVDAFSFGDARDYLAWWGIKSLPKFNTDNPAVRHYLLDVARYWIEMGIDGWRLDVPNEIDDDNFWAEFRQVVKAANPQAHLIGEIWTADRRWVGEKSFDGLMDYPFRDAVLRLLQMGTLDIPHFTAKVDHLVDFYPPENTQAMYVLLGSHDTERLLTKLEGDIAKTRLAFLLQFTYPGTPAIYYGDEIGLTGGKDPECRAAFPWDPKKWNEELHSWSKKMIALRKEHPALRRGEYVRLCADAPTACCALLRRHADEDVVVAINASAEKKTVRIPLGALDWSVEYEPHSLLDGRRLTVQDRYLVVHLDPWCGEMVV